MGRNRLIQLAWLVVMVACVAGAATTVPGINERRQDLQLGASRQVGDEALPPRIAIATTALGPFRGLFIDIMWWRAYRLKEEGKFYEANTLSQWITSMQPRFPVVWEFNAWNMAYNISVVTKTKEERWDWVNKGIRLLRDRGIPLNPRAIKLYRELSWMYFHKINQVSDDAHWYYKSQVTKEWQEVMGQGAIGLTSEQTVETFRRITEAPQTLEALLEQSPLVQPLIDEFQAIGYDLQDVDQRYTLLTDLGKIAMVNYLPQPIFRGLRLIHLPQDIDESIVPIVENQNHTAAMEAMLPYLRYRVLLDSYHMDPEVMLETMERFGPLDWRHPCAHSLYWARKGTIMAEELRKRHEAQEIDYTNAYRQNIFSIQSLMRSGRVTYDPLTEDYSMQPDTRFIDSYMIMMEDAIKNVADDSFKENIIGSYGDGHENFLLQSAGFCYIYGDVERSAKYFMMAKTKYGDKAFNKRDMTYVKGFQEWVFGYIQGNLDTMMNTRQFIDGTLRRSIDEGLRYNNFEKWEHYLRMAATVHKEWNGQRVITILTKQDRQKLPSIPKMMNTVYASYMVDPANHPLVRSRVWANTHNSIRLATYEQIRPIIYQQATVLGLPPEGLFPAPPGFKSKTHPHEQPADPMQQQDRPQAQLETK